MAIRLAQEYALLRPGTGKQEINTARIAEVSKVGKAWKQLAAELQRRRAMK